jgi:flagellar hook-basal body protein
MIKSLFSGVTGLKTHNQRMDVIGNNIANVNTTAFKAGTVTFKDVYYQTRTRASGGDFTAGGVNPSQVGYGVQLGTIGKVMTQSGLTYSDSVFDCALNGSGFFQVMDPSGNIFYTRLGRFSLDDFGNLTDPNGNIVLGVSGDPTGAAAGSQRINIRIPDVDDARASALSRYLASDGEFHEIAINASGFGPGGNVALTLRHSDSPFANMTGTNLNVFMDLTVDYEAMAMFGRRPDGLPATSMTDGGIGGIGEDPRDSWPNDPALVTDQMMEDYSEWRQSFLARVSELFSEDLRSAIRMGGVNIDAALDEISVTFNSVPDVTKAVQASNFRQISPDVVLNFEMDQPGSLGSSRQVNVQTHTGVGVLAQWSGNELTVRIPAGQNVTTDQIQTAVDMAALGRPEFMVTVTAFPVSAVDGPRLNLVDEDGNDTVIAGDFNLNQTRQVDGGTSTISIATPTIPADGTNPAIPGAPLEFDVDRADGASLSAVTIRVQPGATEGLAWDGNTLVITTTAASNTASIQALLAAPTAMDDAPAGVTGITLAAVPTATPQPVHNFSALPAAGRTGAISAVPANPRTVTGFINGRSLPIGMSGGTNSFFQSAFENIQQVTLTGGAFRAVQDPSTVEIEIDRDGVIIGNHPVHGTLLLGRIDIVEFINPEGLQQVGTSYYVATMASGPPQVRIAQEESDTVIIAGALEMSNVDLSQEFSDMIITQRGFQANSRIITVSDSMLEELVNLKR